MRASRAFQLTAALIAVASVNCTRPVPASQDTTQRALTLPPGTTAIELRMNGMEYAAEQAHDPVEPVRQIHVEQSVLVTDDGRYRVRTHSKSPGAPELQFLMVGTPSGSATVELTGKRGIEITRAPAERAREEYMDYLLLAPALLARVPSTRTSRSTNDSRVVYDEYRLTSSVMQPARIVQLAGDRTLAEWQVTDVAAMAAPAADAFDLPPGFVEKTDRGPLRATSLGAGVYRIDGAPSDYHTGFIVGTHSVAVFDAPLGPSQVEQVKAIVEQTVAGRPLAYVVVSHPHGDHVAGLLAYVKDGVRVVAGANAGVALRRQFGDEVEMDLTEVTERQTLDLGGRTVDVYPLASAHSSAMLVGYAPDSGTIFQADLHFLPEVGPATPGAEGSGSAELASLIVAHGLEVRQIIGVHGRTAGPEEVAALLGH